LMELHMPILVGFSARKKQRADGITVPILALTAIVMQSDRDRCEAAGCNGFLTKPIDIDKVLQALSQYLPVDDAEPDVVVAPKAQTPAYAAKSIDEVLQMVDEALAPVTAASIKSPEPTPIASEKTVSARPTQCQKIRSTLPTSIPEFFDIVQQFSNGLPILMAEMQQALADGDYQELGELAHKLKGTGGTVGFAEFTAPSQRLQSLAEAQDGAAISDVLTELEALSDSIELTAAADALPV